MTTVTSISGAVASLQQILSETTQAGASSAEHVRERAAARSYPFPELAAQVFTFLQQKRVAFEKGLSLDDVSEAFVALLLDAQAVETLGQGKSINPWLAVRAALRDTGNAFGKGLLEVYDVVRQTGLGYVPTLLELSQDLAGFFTALAKRGNANMASLRALGAELGLEPWRIALAALWFKQRKPSLLPPTDRDLEDLFADAGAQKALAAEAADGPWEVYTAQAFTLSCVRNFGESLARLADAAEAS